MDAAAVIATLPPEHIGRQVARVAERLGLDHVEVTRAVTDAVTRDGDALGRVSRRDRRGDLDRGALTNGAADTGGATRPRQLRKSAGDGTWGGGPDR